ncbi:hypothetical protein ACT453_24970, partial [Bacillus sp. D-CC]
FAPVNNVIYFKVEKTPELTFLNEEMRSADHNVYAIRSLYLESFLMEKLQCLISCSNSSLCKSS